MTGACPDWCQEKDRGEERYGERHFHVGAKTDITTALGCWVWQDETGQARIYVADGDHTPEQARQLAAGLLRAVALADQIGADA